MCLFSCRSKSREYMYPKGCQGSLEERGDHFIRGDTVDLVTVGAASRMGI